MVPLTSIGLHCIRELIFVVRALTHGHCYFLMDAIPLCDDIEGYIHLCLDTTNFTVVSNFKVN
jgi:hypothetical protein